MVHCGTSVCRRLHSRFSCSLSAQVHGSPEPATDSSQNTAAVESEALISPKQLVDPNPA